MTTTEFQTLLQGQDYDFLRTNKHLGKNILFLTLGGSHAYGTNATNSDVDVRGVAGSPDILGFNHFEQVIDNKTDTVIFAIGKLVSMLVQCNPNIIELLGNDPELYVNMTPEGKMLLDNKELFLSKRVACSYGGFANDQLRRLQMGLLRNGNSPEWLKNKFEKRSLERVLAAQNKLDDFSLSIGEDEDEDGRLNTATSQNLLLRKSVYACSLSPSQNTQMLTFDFLNLRGIILPPQFLHWELLHIYREGILCECSLSFVLRSH